MNLDEQEGVFQPFQSEQDDKKKKHKDLNEDEVRELTGQVKQTPNNTLSALEKEELTGKISTGVQEVGVAEDIPASVPKTKQPKQKFITVQRPMTEEEQKVAVQKANDEFNKNLSDSLQRKRQGIITPEDNTIRSQARESLKQSQQVSRSLEMERLRKMGLNDNEIAKRVPTSFKEGLAKEENQVERLRKVGINSQSVSPDTEKVGKHDIISGFSGKSYIPVTKLEGKFGDDLRTTAVDLHAGYLGFDENERKTIIEALKIADKGTEKFWVEFFGDGGQKTVDSVDELLYSGNQAMRFDDGGDFVEYKDKNGVIADAGILARYYKDPKKVADILLKLRQIEEEDKKANDELLKEVTPYLTGEEQRGFFKALWDGAKSLGINIGYMEQPTNVADFGKRLLGDELKLKLDAQAIQNDPSLINGVIEDENLRNMLGTLLAKRNYLATVPQESIYSELGKIKDTRLIQLAGFPIYGALKLAVPDVDKYLPTTQNTGSALTQLGVAVIPTIGLPLTVAMVERQLANQNPTAYNVGLFSATLGMGAGKLLNYGRPIVGSTATGASQIAIGAAQTGANYYVNWENYRNEDGTINFGLLMQDLIVDVGSSGFDVGEFYGGLTAKKNRTPNEMINMVLKNKDTGQYSTFVRNRDSGVLELVPVEAGKVEAWKQKQKESRRQYIEQELETVEYDHITSKYGTETVRQAFNHLVFGEANPIRDLEQKLIKASRKRDVVKTVEGEGEVVVGQKIDNPKAVFDDTADLVPIQSDARMVGALSKAPDDNRDYSALKLISDYKTPVNINTGEIRDSGALETIRNLEENGYVTVDKLGQVKPTYEGTQLVEKMTQASEGFQKLIDKTFDEYGSKVTQEGMTNVRENMKGNPFWKEQKTQYKYSIQDVMGMGKLQREALAMDIALGKADFNKSTGIVENTSFVEKSKQGEIDFGRQGFEDARKFRMENALVEGDEDRAKAIATDILKDRGLEPTEDNITKVLTGDIDKDTPEEIEKRGIIARAVSSIVERANGNTEPESVIIVDGSGRRYELIKTANGIWKQGKSDVGLPDMTLRKKIEDGEFSVVGKPPRSWSKEREKAKTLYKIQSGEVKRSLIPPDVTREQASTIYGDEGDLYNVAVFGKTAGEWRDENPILAQQGKNMRDTASVEQLVVLNSLERENTKLMKEGVPQTERIVRLNRKAIKDMQKLTSGKSPKKLAKSKRLGEENIKKEINSLKTVFKDADNDTLSSLSKAIRDEEDSKAVDILKQLTGDDFSTKPARIGNIYKQVRDIMESNDFSMLEHEVVDNTGVNGTALNLKSLSPLQIMQNTYNFIFREGIVEMPSGHRINIGDEKWSPQAKPAFEVSSVYKNATYMNEQLFAFIRKLQNKDPRANGIAFDKISLANLSKALRSIGEVHVDKELGKTLTMLADHFDANSDYTSVVRINPSLSYKKAHSAEIHEGTHVNVFKSVNGSKIFDDDVILENIFNSKDGQRVRVAVERSGYAGKDNNIVAHEILAFGTDADTIKALGIESVEDAKAFVKVYTKLIDSINKVYGDEAEATVTKYADKRILEKVKELRNNEERIRQDRLETGSEGRENLEGTGRGDSGESGIGKSYDKLDESSREWRGSGRKVVTVKRFTPDGNPTSLTGVGGAEKAKRIREGGLPTFNFYVRKPDGTYSYEREFVNTKLPFYEKELEVSLVDMSTNEEALYIYRNHGTVRFQLWAEENGFDGFYSSREDWSDAFRYRMSLFDNKSNRSRLSNDVEILKTAKDFDSLDMLVSKRLKESDTFMKWFSNGMLTDLDGNPTIMYHGTKVEEPFDIPDPAVATRNLGVHIGTLEQSHFFVLNVPKIIKDFRDRMFSKNPDEYSLRDYYTIVKYGYDRSANKDKFLIENDVHELKGLLENGINNSNSMSYFSISEDDSKTIQSVLQRDYARIKIGEYSDPLDLISKKYRPIEEFHYGIGYTPKDRIYPIVSNIKNPLILKDLGTYWGMKEVAWQLEELGLINERVLRDRIEYKKSLISEQINDLDTRRSKEALGNREIYDDYSKQIVKLEFDRDTVSRDEIKEVILNSGYDSVKYWNTAEGEDWSYIIFDKNNIRNVFDPEFAVIPEVKALKEQTDLAMLDASPEDVKRDTLIKKHYSTRPEELRTEEIHHIIQKGNFSAFTAVKNKDTSNMENLKKDLRNLGFIVKDGIGKYTGDEEDMVFVYYPNAESSRLVQVLSNKYNQESAFHGKNGVYSIEFADGKRLESSNISIDKVSTTNKGNKFVQNYAKKLGIDIDLKDKGYMSVPSKELMTELANKHIEAEHSPNSPEVQKAYKALVRETVDQFDSIKGIKIEAWEGDGEPYISSAHMVKDIESGHYYFLKTDNAFGSNQQSVDNIMLLDSGKRDSKGNALLNNDVFRIVHDLMGHTGNKWQFGIRGEWNAFASHADLYSSEALPALMSETLMQNAVVALKNYEREGDIYTLKSDPKNVEFADQKMMIPDSKTVKKIMKAVEKQSKKAKELDKDGTYLKTKDGNIRFSVDFDWDDIKPAPQNYSLKLAEEKIALRQKLNDTSIVTPEELRKIWSGEVEWEDAQGNKIDPNDVYDNTGRLVGKVEVDDEGQEYVKIGKNKVNLVNGYGSHKEGKYFVGKNKRDIVATTGMFQELVRMMNPDLQLQKPKDNSPEELERYRVQKSELMQAHVKSLLSEWNKMDGEDYGSQWYREGVADFASKVGRDIKDVSTDIGKLWLYLTTAVTSPNTEVTMNTKFAMNAMASLVRFYETGKLTIPKFQYDNYGNVILKEDGTPKMLGLGSAQLEKVEMLTKGYIPADTMEGWVTFDLGGEVKSAKDLTESAIKPKTKYIKSDLLTALIDRYGALQGVISYLLAPSVRDLKFNKAVDILGDKLGAFFSNLAGMSQIPTIDTWMNRYFMGITGDALSVTRDKSGAITKVKDNTTNFDPREGDLMRGVIQKATEDFNMENGTKLTPADTQAIIWTQVKSLYASMFEKEMNNVDFSQAYDSIKNKIDRQEPSLFSGINEEMPRVESNKSFVEDSDLSNTPVKSLYDSGVDEFGKYYFIEKGGLALSMEEAKPDKIKKDKIDMSDPLLQEADFDAWLNLASQFVTSGLISDGEANQIRKLSNKKDVEGLQKYVLGLNKMGVLELFVNVGRIALLLGVKNISKNIGGNSLKIFMDEISRLPASVLDLAFIEFNRLAGGKNFDNRNTSFVTNPIITSRAYKEAFKDFFTTGLKDSYDTLTGKHLTNFEHPSFSRERTTGITFLKPLEIFERYGWALQGALDRPFNAFAYTRAIAELQGLRQKQQKALGNNISYKEADEYLTPADFELARDMALNASYQGHNRVASKYYNIVEGLPPVWKAISNNIFKFVKTPLNVVDYILDYSGIWQLAKLADSNRRTEDFINWKTSIKKVLDTPEERKILSMAISQGMIGTAMIHIGFKMAEAGFLTAFYEEDEYKEKEQMTAKGTSYASAQFDGYNVDVSWLSPVAFYLFSGASTYSDYKKYDSNLAELENKLANLTNVEGEPNQSEIDSIQKKIDKLKQSSPSNEVISRILKNLALQTPFARQAIDAYEAVDRGKGVAGIVSNWVAPETYVPAIVKEVAETIDTKERVSRNTGYINQTVDKIQQKIPTLSGVKDIGKSLQDTEIPVVSEVGKVLQGREALPVKYDMLGRPIERGYGVDPLRTKKIDDSKLVSEMDRLNVSIGQPNSGTSIERNEYKKSKGEFFRPYLEKIVESEEYNSVDDEFKKEILKDSLGYLSRVNKDRPAEDYVNHKINLISDMNKFTSDVKTDGDKFNVESITDKEIIRDVIRAEIKPSDLTIENIKKTYGSELDKFISKMYRFTFEPDNEKTTLSKAKEEFDKFKQDRGKYIINYFASQLEYEARQKRLDSWRKELSDKGLEGEELDKAIRSRSSKLGKINGYKYRTTKEIRIK